MALHFTLFLSVLISEILGCVLSLDVLIESAERQNSLTYEG